MVKLDTFFNLDVTDDKELREHGYNPTLYYCGSKRSQNIFTKLRDKFNKLFGVPFPYNPACFKHDVLYGEILVNSDFGWFEKLKWKIKADFVFYDDMRKLQEWEVDSKWVSHLKWRARIYLVVVILFTPIYITFIRKRK